MPKEKVEEDPPAGDIDPAKAAEIELMLSLSTTKERLKASEDENTKLSAGNRELAAKLEQQRADQADIYYYLHRKLDDNYDKMAGLESQLVELQAEKERKEAEATAAAENVAADHKSVLAGVEADLAEAKDKLNDLKEFAENKERIEARLASLEAELEREKAAHLADTTSLERKNVQEKERLKKEMLIKIKETKQNLLSMTEDQLHTVTKRTIMENEQMVTELQYQSKETEKLLQQSDRIRSENVRLRRDMEILRVENEELAKKSHFYNRVVRKLHDKLKRGGGLTDASEAEVSPGDGESELSGLWDGEKGGSELEAATPARIRSLQRKLGDAEAKLDRACADLAKARRDAQLAQAERQRMLARQHANVRFLLRVADEARTRHLAVLANSQEPSLQLAPRPGTTRAQKRQQEQDVARLDSQRWVDLLEFMLQRVGSDSSIAAQMRLWKERLVSPRQHNGPPSVISVEASGPGIQGSSAEFRLPAIGANSANTPDDGLLGAMQPSGFLVGGDFSSLQPAASETRTVASQTDTQHTAETSTLPDATMSRGGSAYAPYASRDGTAGSSLDARFSRNLDTATSTSFGPFPSTASRMGSADGMLDSARSSRGDGSVIGPVRPWGKRAVAMPMTHHSTGTFLRRKKRSEGSWR